jgi:hypothetical protein
MIILEVDQAKCDRCEDKVLQYCRVILRGMPEVAFGGYHLSLNVRENLRLHLEAIERDCSNGAITLIEENFDGDPLDLLSD